MADQQRDVIEVLTPDRGGGQEGGTTRPHPSAPDSPPGIKVLGPVTGLLDRMRDAVSKRGTQG